MNKKKTKCPKKFKYCGCKSFAHKPHLQKVYHQHKPGEIFTHDHNQIIVGQWDYEKREVTKQKVYE